MRRASCSLAYILYKCTKQKRTRAKQFSWSVVVVGEHYFAAAAQVIEKERRKTVTLGGLRECVCDFVYYMYVSLPVGCIRGSSRRGSSRSRAAPAALLRAAAPRRRGREEFWVGWVARGTRTAPARRRRTPPTPARAPPGPSDRGPACPELKTERENRKISHVETNQKVLFWEQIYWPNFYREIGPDIKISHFCACDFYPNTYVNFMMLFCLR